MNSNLKSLILSPDTKSVWDNFANNSDDAWFVHTTTWLKWVQEISNEKFMANLSFFIKKEDEIVAICPLIIEKGPYGKQFSFLEAPIPSPALLNNLEVDARQKVFEYYAQVLNQLAREQDVNYVSIKIPAPSKNYIESPLPVAHPMLKYGYTNLPYLTQVIDLKKEEKQIWQQIRKGHRADIKKALKQCQAFAWDQSNINSDKIAEYQQLHQKDAGRKTRSESTFEMMHNWIRNNYAILVEVRVEEKPAAFALIMTYKNGAYYGSGCKDPDRISLRASHLVQWKAIQWLKDHNYTIYDVGLQWFQPQWFITLDEKEFSIAHFKRGFGGQTIPLLTAEYFFSDKQKSEVYNQRMQEFTRTLKVYTAA